MNDRGSIQDIKKRRVGKPNRANGNGSSEVSSKGEFVEPHKMEKRRVSKSRTMRVVIRSSIFVLIIIVISFVISSTVFSSSDIRIVLREDVVNVEGTVISSSDISASSDAIPYFYTKEVIEEDVVVIPADQMENVNVNATGIATLVNNLTEESIRLRVGTRLQAENGLIFRIPTATVLPGISSAQGETIPGMIQVEVYADEPGEEYNISDGIFVLPGFREAGETSYFENVTAILTSPLTGGYSGTRFSIDDSTLEGSVNSLRNRLEIKAKEQIGDLVPEGSFFIEEETELEFVSVEREDDTGENSVILTERVIARGIYLKQEDLAQLFASESSIDSDTLPNRITCSDELSITSTDTDSENSGTMEFSYNGSLCLGWELDEEGLRNALSGIAEENAQNVFDTYDAIESARIDISPSFKNKLPENPDRINIIIDQ